MSKLKKKKSQVSRDFADTLNVVIKAGFQNLSDENDQCSQDSPTFPTISKISFSDTLKDEFGKLSFITMKSTGSSSSSSKNFNDSKDQYTISDNSKQNITIENEASKISSKNKNAKIPFFIKNLFSYKNESAIPFEITSLSNLTFQLNITLNNDEQIFIRVRKYFTIDKLINLISKKKPLKYDEISLFHNSIRLEKHITLSSYNITVKSNLRLEILKKIEIITNYLSKQYVIAVYNSQMVYYIKSIISKKLNIERDLLELTFNDVILKDNKELFFYEIKERSQIYIQKRIVKEPDINIKDINNPGLEVVQQYKDMADALEICDCRKKRINAITMGILAVLERTLGNFNRDLLKEFDKNLHHVSCIKSNNRCSSYSTVSANSQSFESEMSEVSSKEVSLDDCIYAEIGRVEQKKKMIIEESDLEFLCNVKNFKEFKHFLKDKLGRQCTLRSVSMLYKYGMELVLYIGSDEEENPYVKKMLNYIKLFFEKYYEKDIINKGGLVALTLTGSDVDD